jgi:phosphoribosylformylglycinamidine cyclo-ligase
VGRIEKGKIKRVIAGMVDYLEACGCILAGGETAEMPDMVEEDMIELSGFCIGAAEKRDLIDPSTLAVGDQLIGCASDGFHANGWSLVRKVLNQHAISLSEEALFELLAPTRLYHEEVAALKEAGIPPKAMAHITGGGLPENLERLLDGKGMRLQLPVWENAPVQEVLHHLEEAEAIRTFNMGFGWVVAVAPDHVEKALELLPRSTLLGEVTANSELQVEVAQG